MSRVKLVATDGMILTNGEICGKMVFLGTGDSPNNWWEVTEAQAKHIMKQEGTVYDENLY